MDENDIQAQRERLIENLRQYKFMFRSRALQLLNTGIDNGKRNLELAIEQHQKAIEQNQKQKPKNEEKVSLFQEMNK